jgi:hypothetical protein
MPAYIAVSNLLSTISMTEIPALGNEIIYLEKGGYIVLKQTAWLYGHLGKILAPQNFADISTKRRIIRGWICGKRYPLFLKDSIHTVHWKIIGTYTHCRDTTLKLIIWVVALPKCPMLWMPADIYHSL